MARRVVPAISEVVTSEHIINVRKPAPLGTQSAWKLAVKEMENSDVHVDTRLNKAVCAKETGMSYTVIHV